MSDKEGDITITGYWPSFLANPVSTADGPGHFLGGSNNLRGAVSPNSGRPLLRLVSYHSLDPRLSKLGWKRSRIDLLFSWTCALSQGVFAYQIASDEEVRIIDYTAGEAYDDFPYRDYPDAFPQRQFVLRQIEQREQDDIVHANADGRYRLRLAKTRPDLTRPQHQIGGIPHLVQPPRTLACPVCSKLTPLIASVSSESMSERPFVDNDYVQVLFHACADCSVLLAYTRTD